MTHSTTQALCRLQASPSRPIGHDRPQPPASDEQLLARYTQSGDREAFEELVRRYERPLYNYLRKFLGNAELAEDAFQATFLQVHLNCGRFEPSRRLRPWLYQIATRQAIDLRRRNKRHQALSLNTVGWDTSATDEGEPQQNLLETREMGPGQHAEAAEDSRRVRQAAEKIPARLREVLAIVMFQGFKYQEAADRLGIPLGSVKSRLHAALESLRTEFHRTRRYASRSA